MSFRVAVKESSHKKYDWQVMLETSDLQEAIDLYLFLVGYEKEKNRLTASVEYVTLQNDAGETIMFFAKDEYYGI